MAVQKYVSGTVLTLAEGVEGPVTLFMASSANKQELWQVTYIERDQISAICQGVA
jgi:hypothetical protein